VPQRLQVGIAAEKGRERQGERDATELSDRRVVSRRPRAPNERVTGRTSQVQCPAQRAHGLDMGPASFPALQRAHGMNRKARNRRELFLRVARSLAERLELRPKRPRSARFHGPFILLQSLYGRRTGVVRELWVVA